MKKNDPFWELFYCSLKKTVPIIGIVIILLIPEIQQAYSNSAPVNYLVIDDKTTVTVGNQTTPSEQQQGIFKGTVTDEKGNILPGVSVIVKGTTLGILTDVSGKYIINGAPQNATLIFSFIGMTTQEI